MNQTNSLKTTRGSRPGWKMVFEKMRSQPVKLLTMALVPLLVVVCHWVAMARQAANLPPHQNEIIEELCSIRLPSGRPVPNHAGTKLIFCKYTKENAWGWGINLHDIDSRKTTFLSHGGDESTVIWGWKILGWSPDDRFFAYARSGYMEVVVCDGNSGAELGVIKCGGRVSAGTWLNSGELVCSDGQTIDEIYHAGTGWVITPFSKSADSESEWRTPIQSNSPSLLFSRHNNTDAGLIQLLAPLVGNSAVWQRSDALWMGKSGSVPCELWRGTNTTLKEFSFSAPAGKFLLHCADNQGDFLAEFYPAILGGDNLLTNIVRLDTSEYQPQQITLINGGKGYLYLNHNGVSLDRLVVKMNGSSPPLETPWKSEIRGFEINGTQLYLNASSTNEPAGIWRYDLISGSSECLVSCMEKPFRYASTTPIIQGFVTNAAGEQLTYYLLPPAVTLGKEKHPMVVGIMGIGEKGYVWNVYLQTISSSGAYFLCMDRHKRDWGQWAADALCAYEYLAKNYAVDTNKVYLMGVSAGVSSVDYLLQTKPELWKGAIYYNGGLLAYHPGMRNSTILLDTGGDEFPDEAARQRFYQTQEPLAAAGIRPILIVRPGIGHLSASMAVGKERLLKLAPFIQQP